MARSTRYRFASLLLIGLGLGVSGYLLLRTFSLYANSTGEGIDVCSAVFGTGCDATLLDRRAWLLGIPPAGWGLVYYGALAWLVVTGWMMHERFQREAVLGALLLAFGGAVVSIVLAALLIAGFAPFCPLCLVVHAVNLLLVVSLKGLTGRSLSDSLRSLKTGLGYLIGRSQPAQRDAPWKVLAFFNAALVAALVYQWVYVEATARSRSGGPLDPARIVAAFEQLPTKSVPVSSDDPRLGPANAPAQMVVFGSFQCPGCRRLAAEFPRLRDEFGDGLCIVFKHYPLSTTCNARMEKDKHPQSCQAAYAACASQRQGRFWEFHDALFASAPDVSQKRIERIVAKLGLDAVRFAADAVDPAVGKKVAADVALGTRLHIVGTPAVFLNGKPVRPASPRVLEVLIRHELNSHRTKQVLSSADRRTAARGPAGD